MTAYHTKHRPSVFDMVKGQDHVIKPLQTVLEKGTSQAILLQGPSGCGKTTLARIACAVLEVEPGDLLEIDAATHSGIDKMRDVQEVLRYRPIGGGKYRAIILDECHRLSPAAWDAILKATEEPSPHVFWFFCTTNGAKVPTTIKTRCSSFMLKPVREDLLEAVVRRVIKREKLTVSDAIVQIICREAGESPRQALTNLASVQDCANAKEASAILRSVQESDATIELCRFLLKGGGWIKAMGIFKRLADENPEGVRIVVCNYMASVLKGASTEDGAIKALTILEHWATPYNSAEGHAPLLLSIGRSLFSE